MTRYVHIQSLAGSLGLALFLLPAMACAQDADALARQLSNAIASLTSMPMQLNWDTGLGADGEGELLTLNVYQAGVRYYLEGPDSGAQWGLRFTFSLLYPKR